LHKSGRLAALVTDWYAFQRQSRKQKVESRNEEGENRNRFQLSAFKISAFDFLVSAFQYFGRRGQSALAARCSGLPDDLVRAFPVRSLLWKWRVRRLAARGRSHEAFLHTDAAFASAVARCHLPPHEVFFGYSYASLETLAAEKQRGALTVLDQIDPGAVEFRLVAEEMARFPELAGPPPPFPAAYYERNRREWELADRIIVNSRWSFDALVQQGVPPGKLVIVPLCYEKKAEMLKAGTPKHRNTETPKHRNTETPPSALRVLWLGQVNVRKGIHYLMAAARLLEQNPVAADVSRLKLEGNHPQVHFDVVGPIGISEAAVKSAPPNMTFHGPVSRDCAEQWYEQSDVFVLPTLSDGFALTQIEAMAHGLPVIATPNCGEVVSDGVDGFIVPARDAEALAGTIRRYLAEPGLLERHRAAALKKSGQFTLDKLAVKLEALEDKLRFES
jgi:glycosyltransferase involved in cell wall biosynthesis